tara:strand:- start:9859 stop:10011 length:153 start_codon:yes stop_codon:yes gene_type:complete
MNEEYIKTINKTIDAEMEKTPDDMVLNVSISMEKEGVRLDFSRSKKEVKE